MSNTKTGLYLNTSLGRISYILEESDQKRGIVLFGHGMGGSKNSQKAFLLGERFLDMGLSYIAFDFFGHGESEGKLECLNPRDSEYCMGEIYEFVSGLGYSLIGLCGNSYGGLIALSLACKKSVSFLILISPVSDYMSKEIAKYGEDWVLKRERLGYCTKQLGVKKVDLKYSFLSSMNAYIGTELGQNVSCPTIILHGFDDGEIPPQQSVELSKSIKDCRLFLITGVDHRFSDSLRFLESIEYIVDFIDFVLSDGQLIKPSLC